MSGFEVRLATEADTPLVLDFIRRLAEYERLAHEVVATERDLRETLFGERRYAEVLLGFVGDEPVAFALFFHNYSTFLGRPGIYLEDLFVLPERRGSGYGKAMLRRLAKLAVKRNCGRLEWWVLDWNEDAIGFYRSLGAVPMDEWTTMRLAGDSLKELASDGSSSG
ncbi:GNAT family N-acetyltransferase [Rubrobacter radiotolerans]|uniref:GNAT family N-acetyltransferase n=1 Tax=Rubrobacter radiotolerans TaxID=42256 RepID=UPI00057049B2|nr:L-amino acid N-acyltransferase YncA [Rubrobacter radiotolerans DSM 5868]